MSLSGLPSSIELLETRIAPAGIITLEQDAYGYVLSGDADANDLLITQDGSEITLTPQAGTRILNKIAGQTTSVDTPLTIPLWENALLIRMEDGADVLTLQGLTLSSNLVINMGGGASADSLTITDNLQVGGNLSITLNAGTASITGETLHVAYDASIFSKAQTVTLDVGSFYVGSDLNVNAQITNNADTFELIAANIFVYDDFELSANVVAADAPMNAISVEADNTLSVGGNLQVGTQGVGDCNVSIAGRTVIFSGQVIAKNESGSTNRELSLNIAAQSVLRMDNGLSLTSTSSALSAVSILSDLVIIDGSVTAKLPKSAGTLSIVADEVLRIQGNVNFVSKGEGILNIEGGGDIYGKVNASLGIGTGSVNISGAEGRPLLFDGLKITAPGKNTPTTGITVGLEDVSLFGKVSLLLGRGADTININDSVFRSAVSISTGDGNDTVNIHTEGTSLSEFRNGLSVLLGNGDDALKLGRTGAFDLPTALLVYAPKAINGGAGTDTYLASGQNVKFLKSFSNRVEITPVVRAFEADVV